MIYKLTIELVPQSSWYNNVRSNVSKNEWDRIRKKSYKLANSRCQICGLFLPLECHEIWQYDDDTCIQKLIGLIALCRDCHRVKHPGLARIRGEEQKVLSQLRKINKMAMLEAIKYLEESFKKYEERSLKTWKLDTNYLKEYMK
jgi:hypothetical protein